MSGLAATLQGRAVVLEPLERRHEEPLWEAATEDRTVWRWMRYDAGASRERFRGWVEEALAEPRAAPFATVGADGRVLGSTRFTNIREADRVVEIGYTWLRRSAWGGGANVEAKLLMLARAFEGWGAQRVELKTDARNERSRGALEALGARFEGISRKHMLCEYGVRDSAWYAIVDDEWPEVRRTLEARLRRAAPASAGRAAGARRR